MNKNVSALPDPDVICLAAVDINGIVALLAGHGVTLKLLAGGADIPASHWGAPEAGLTASGIHARPDTPVHSILHEAAHYICMSATRRAALAEDGTGDAGGDVAEEDAVCYLQILLGSELESAGFGRDRLLRDMDAWGYSFRLGSARRWFEQDAEEALMWLKRRGLVSASGHLAPCR